jgi:hemerythrin-like domain-containing protein
MQFYCQSSSSLKCKEVAPEKGRDSHSVRGKKYIGILVARFAREVFSVEFADLLNSEHRAIRRAVNVLRTMTEQVEHGLTTDRHDVNALLIFLHYFGDACHQAKEESILFPALKPSEKFPLSVQPEKLLREHHEERGLIESAQLALFTDKQDEFIASARRVADLLLEHADKEEHVLFPLAEGLMTREMANEVTGKLQEADAKFGFTQRKLLMDMLDHLEDKYIRKAA